MPDKLTPSQRSYCMSRIRGKDTKPEILVRRGLHARGFRFRLQERRLPGKPDIALPKYGVAIMVNGCFWHGHKGCTLATRPKTNMEFWENKNARNRHRDEVTRAHLEALGWNAITVWECEWKDWWEFPGGKIEVGELIETVEWDYPAFHLTMHCFVCSLVSESMHLNEHEASAWLTRET